VTEPFNQLGRAPWGPVLFNRHDINLGACLRDHGEFSAEEIDVLAGLLRPGDLVIDVGANIGALTVPLAQAVGPTGHVVAIEPQRLMFQLLCANVALNSLANVTCLNAASGARGGTIAVPQIDPHNPMSPGSVSFHASLPNGAVTERVPITPIDTLPVRLVDNVRLIKIDVEGMETQVLMGAEEVVKAFKPALYVENDRPANGRRLMLQLEKMGYRSWWHFPRLVRDEAPGGPSDIRERASLNMLCLPLTHEPIDGLEPVVGYDDTAEDGYARLIGKLTKETAHVAS